MPHRVVLHSHPIDLIANTLSEETSHKLHKKLSNFSWQLINYARPGYPLANLIKKSISKKKSNVLILKNHGLIVGAETVKKAEKLQNDVINKMKIEPRNTTSPKLKELHKIIELLPNSKLPSKDIIHSLATDEWSFKIAKGSAPYPDHVIFCGAKPLIIYDLNINLDVIKNFDYCIIPEIGVLIFKEESKNLEIMLEMQALIYLRLKINSPVKLLSKRECKELEFWEAENYRKKLLGG